MKKSTKVLIVAASAVAVVGIGAVSFAKWTGGTREATVNGSTDSISLQGFTTTSYTLSALKPFDQATTEGDTSVTLGNTTYQSVTLAVAPDGKSYDITAKYAATPATGNSWTGKIYAKVAETTPTDEITLSTDGGEASLLAKGWVELGTSTAVDIDGSGHLSATAPVVYFLLLSNSTGDMNATISVDLTLAEVTA